MKKLFRHSVLRGNAYASSFHFRFHGGPWERGWKIVEIFGDDFENVLLESPERIA